MTYMEHVGPLIAPILEDGKWHVVIVEYDKDGTKTTTVYDQHGDNGKVIEVVGWKRQHLNGS